MKVAGLILLLAVAAVFLLLGFRYLVRGTPIRRIRGGARSGEAPAIDGEHFTSTLELLTRVDLLRGHTARFSTCGDNTFPQLWDDLRGAQTSITMQMYYANKGKVADQLQQILVERARAGVKVLFLRDAFGASGVPQEYFDVMSDAGVEVAIFRPFEWYSIEKAYARSHIRVVTVDAKIGWTGGFGIDDKWLGDGRTADQWRDTTARFTGPAVAQLQATFAAGWAEATGQLLTGRTFFPQDPDAGTDNKQDPAAPMRAGLLHAAPTVGSTPAERFLALTIGAAQERLWITNAYFVPDLDFVGLLTHAAERGTDVRVLVPRVTDSKTVYFAGQQTYGQLAEAGVKIYEYLPTMLHAKTIVGDRCFSGIGTMNFDNRSMSFNDESMFLVYDDDFNDRLANLFLADLELSEQYTLTMWRQRPWWMRHASKMAYSLRRVL
ncbi:MAG: hypothetical protein H0X64_10475 [Gemmatimonadaceae bacterium]|nr:hypothetical protein [Gemmatimonadaceae bacterium]